MTRKIRKMVYCIALLLMTAAASAMTDPADPTETSNPTDQDSLRAKLDAEFEARQELLRAKVSEFRRRLATIEQTIESRERMKNKIIERRMEELLNPDPTWEGIAESRIPNDKPHSPTESNDGAASELTPNDLLEEINGLATLRSKLQGQWVMGSNPDEAKQKTVTFDVMSSEYSCTFRQGSQELRMKVGFPLPARAREHDRPRFAEHGSYGIRFVGATETITEEWLGKFDLQDGKLRLMITGANYRGVTREPADAFRKWSGVYQRMPENEDAGSFGSTGTASSLIAATPQTAVVWVEAIIENDEDGDAAAVYMNGVLISADGLVAIPFSHHGDPAKTLRSARVRLADDRVLEARLAAYDPKTQLGLLQVDADGLTHLALASDSPVANLRLSLYWSTVSIDGQWTRMQHEARVTKLMNADGEIEGLFAFEVFPSGPRGLIVAYTPEQEHRGAPLVDARGNLVGIVSELRSVTTDETRAPVVEWTMAAVPAQAIAKLIDEVRTKSTNPQP